MKHQLSKSASIAASLLLGAASGYLLAGLVSSDQFLINDHSVAASRRMQRLISAIDIYEYRGSPTHEGLASWADELAEVSETLRLNIDQGLSLAKPTYTLLIVDREKIMGVADAGEDGLRSPLPLPRNSRVFDDVIMYRRGDSTRNDLMTAQD